MTTESKAKTDSKTENKGVIDLASFRKKKETESELARGRQPLYVSHLTGKIDAKAGDQTEDAADFGDLLQRIRTSLDKINRLMSELKRMSTDETPFDRRSQNRRR